MVLLEPDGTVLELNRKDAPWRDDGSARSGRAEDLGRADDRCSTRSTCALMKKAIAAGGGRASSSPGGADGARRAFRPPTSTSRCSRCAGADGEIIYLLFEARDITDLKAAQEQLRQSQKMEALGQLTGGIAHDFNNLLTVVVGGLDIIAKRAEDAKLKRYAENALAAAERGARLTGQLLAFSRVQRLEVRPTYVAPLIQNMRPLLRNVLGPGIAKKFDLDEAMMPVMADPTQLEVAVLNLAINARDAMPDGGMLTFVSTPVSVAGDPDLEDGDYIELTISDTGVGMPPEVARARVRALLHHQGGRQGHRPRPVDGLWHGAPVGRRRADRKHAGRRAPRSSSCSARPTTTAGEAAAGTDEPASARSELAPLSILVIDDDPDVRGFIVASLEEQGYRVREASDGREGLAEVEREGPDLVIARLHHARPLRRRSRQPDPRQAPRPADPVRLRLQRDRRGQAHRPRRAAARQALPRRSAAESGARGARRRQG